MMGKTMWAGLLATIVAAFVCGGIWAFTLRGGLAEAALSEEETAVGVDADPTGNTGTSLGTINSCISVSSTDSFYIDLFVKYVTNLNSYTGFFLFDGSIVEVTGVDVVGPVGSEYFLATASGSDVSSFSGGVPDDSGAFLVGAFDYERVPESGEGVVVRLEITAIGTGTSKANFDLRPDGIPYSGVVLLDETDTVIGDLDGDDYFDGSVFNAEIAVDEPCPGECLPGVDTDADGFDDDIECYLPTDPLDDCPNNPSHDAWPLDINIDTMVNLGGDVYNFQGTLGSSEGEPAFVRRLDLNGDHVLNLGGDVYNYAGKLGASCSNN